MKLTLLVLIPLLLTAPNLRAQDAAATDAATDADTAAAEAAAAAEVTRRRTAVTLNYCRAALHRIRSARSKAVIVQEQQRILSNLDLNQIEDPEVIALYKSVLDEIGSVEISDRERTVIDEQYQRGMHRKLGTDLFVIGAQAVTAQFGSMIQTGANSWWDYRTRQSQRDASMWKVEKQTFTSAMSRSSTFLDSFWKLSRKNNIPDRWLVRDLDLDQLRDALADSNPEKRLRKLERMDRFMECYPPYWYYVARTQQQLGRRSDAVQTYRQLADIGSGHFRQDDMLAGSMANLAMLLEADDQPDAAETALLAYDYSIRNWEANLLCAWVLGRNARYSEAENLILCNLDENLETEQTSVAMVSLYYHSDNVKRLAEVLDDEAIVRRIPVPGLLLCATKLGAEKMPLVASSYLSSTLTAFSRYNGRARTVSVAAAHSWKLADAGLTVRIGHQTFRSAGVRNGPEGVEMEFLAALDSNAAEEQDEVITLELQYPGTPPIQVVFATQEEPNREGRNRLSRIPGFGSGSSAELQHYRISEIEVEGVRISVRPTGPDSKARSVLLPPVEELESVIR
jgi:hypothetical protein